VGSTPASKQPIGLDQHELEPLLDVDDLTRLLKLPRKSVYRLVEEDDLPTLRVGRRLRFDPVEVREWLAARRNGARR
jgi:excisionase family DNA binding protein